MFTLTVFVYKVENCCSCIPLLDNIITKSTVKAIHFCLQQCCQGCIVHNNISNDNDNDNDGDDCNNYNNIYD